MFGNDGCEILVQTGDGCQFDFEAGPGLQNLLLKQVFFSVANFCHLPKSEHGATNKNFLISPLYSLSLFGCMKQTVLLLRQKRTKG